MNQMVKNQTDFHTKKLFFCKYSIIELNKIFSRIFPRIGNKEIGQ